jgi:ribosomal protein S18 acetylase RimI-like enzyme
MNNPEESRKNKPTMESVSLIEQLRRTPIVEATSAYFPSVVELINTCYLSEEFKKPEHLQRITIERLKGELLDSDAKVFIIKAPQREDSLEEQVIGCIHFRPAETDDFGNSQVGDASNVGYFGLLAVHPDYQHLGIATNLIDKVETYAATQGFKWMVIQVVNVQTALLEMYQGFGYEPTGEKPWHNDELLKPEFVGQVAFVVMTKTLSD